MPGLERLAETLALPLDAEVDVARRPAERRRPLAGLEVVDSDRAAEGHVQMGMRVDATRQHVLSGRIDRLVGLHVE